MCGQRDGNDELNICIRTVGFCPMECRLGFYVHRSTCVMYRIWLCDMYDCNYEELALLKIVEFFVLGFVSMLIRHTEDIAELSMPSVTAAFYLRQTIRFLYEQTIGEREASPPRLVPGLNSRLRVPLHLGQFRAIAPQFRRSSQGNGKSKNRDE